MQRKNQIRIDNLARLMVYILGHRPDEFGLVPDEDGFIMLKELLWALHEEQGWGFVRHGHINEVLMGRNRSLFELENDRIRTVDRRWDLDLHTPYPNLPRILFTPVRTRAHAHAIEKGLKSDKYLVLSQKKEMALRIGRRRDPRPVLLEILPALAAQVGVHFFSFGDLFLATEIPPGCILGPPVAKELREKGRTEPSRKTRTRPLGVSAGSFTLDVARDPDLSRRSKAKKRRGWKEEARKQRRKKAR
ncbi:MAG: hypothetical protein JRI81_08455 [Deltaproteobacteria bacterium]|nr:hypothetical protein [Deltaproteobacteria bacterium]